MRLPAWFAERAGPVPEESEIRVSTLELFFDLVFVFTITQLTHLLVVGFGEDGHGTGHAVPIGESALRVLLVFGVMWWMYSGYVWLTNTIPPARPARRVLILLGMAGFTIMALSIPTAFDGSGVAFAIGYLLLVLVHAGLYLQATAAIVRVVPFNLAATALIGVAGYLHGPWNYVLWAAALVLVWGSPYFIGQKGFPLRAEHIVERHGLLVIVVLGESMLAIGIGAAGLAVDWGLGLAAVLGLALGAALWWVYFGGDDEVRAEHALRAAGQERRTRLILGAYFYAHIPMLLGVIAVAAGIKKLIGHPLSGMKPAAAVVLAAGVALFLAGDHWYRRLLAIPQGGQRALVAVAALATIPLGLWSGIVQIAVLVALLVAMLALEGRRERAAVTDVAAGP
ncbi:low temperature requirement protein LtrA [Thermocatellispora tengchongensis]|uniref:Low temperature requirement protein LtrA n=1 Tax=Thermocatellispora tengchongensis TaxID=1073253 RepID=A0A840PCM7_9ACTN|nr:low temperature requirement protein A [Thermocatellispora tengchongensis]MBB5135180.1 low temperature requirement protein LtrA [Thermocatellispora tengchongensis]